MSPIPLTKFLGLSLLTGLMGNLVKKFFQPSKCSLLGRKSKSQFLKIWFFDHFWANSNYGNAKNWEYGLWEFWLLFSKANKLKIDVDLQFICLRKQQSKFPLKMLTRRRLRMSQLAEPDWNFKFVNKKVSREQESCEKLWRNS